MRFRIVPIALGTVLLCAAGAGTAGAQRLQLRVPPPASTAASPAGVPGTLAPRSHPSLLRTLLWGAGGAVLGSWVGYMTSQVVWSDWQRVSHPNGISRMRYTLTGAGVGAVVGALVGRHATPGATPGRPVYGIRPAITTEEIEASATRTVEDLVRLLRPQWLNPRGNDLLQVIDSSTVLPPGGDVVRVYLDGEPLGGPDELAQIPTPEVLRVEYYDMKAATLRWGAGLSHGAINVITARGQR